MEEEKKENQDQKNIKEDMNKLAQTIKKIEEERKNKSDSSDDNSKGMRNKKGIWMKFTE